MISDIMNVWYIWSSNDHFRDDLGRYYPQTIIRHTRDLGMINSLFNPQTITRDLGCYNYPQTIIHDLGYYLLCFILGRSLFKWSRIIFNSFNPQTIIKMISDLSIHHSILKRSYVISDVDLFSVPGYYYYSVVIASKMHVSKILFFSYNVVGKSMKANSSP